MSNLDGLIGDIATAELDGNGRTTLIADGLQWKLIDLPGGATLTAYPYTGAGITKLTGTTDKYIVSFIRPGPEMDYAIRWNVPLLGEFDESFRTYHTLPENAGSFTPDVSDVGALIRARTKDQFGNELGTFTANTRPTGDEVSVLIDRAIADVTAKADTDIPVNSYNAAKSVIALRAAMMVEMSYWPDQIPLNQSPYVQMRQDYEGADGQSGMLGDLLVSINRENEELVSGETPAHNSPVYSFPDDSQKYLRRSW
jgi:hypothetical protein